MEVNSENSTEEDSEAWEKRKKQEKATSFVSIFLITTYFFTMIATLLGGYLLEIFPKKLLFKITAIFWVIPFLAVFVFYEKRKTTIVPRSQFERRGGLWKSFARKMKILGRYLKEGFIVKPTIFIFLVLLTPSVDSVMFSFQINQLKFSPSFLSIISVATYITNIIAVLIYRRYLQHIGMKKIITFTTIFFSLFQALRLLIIFEINLRLGISNKVFFIVTECLYSFTNEIHLMPLMVMAWRVCPKNLEATVYEFIMSVINLGYLVSYQSGGILSEWLHITNQNFDNLWIHVLISSIFPCIVLWAVFIIPSDFASKVEAFSKKIAAEKEE